MSVATFTKNGTKASVAAKLDKAVFGVDVTHHELVKQAYVSYLANGRENLAKTKLRGEVRGGGRKPWKQKGTGRARFGSSRNPIWRGGGIVFGPTGNENYAKKMPRTAKQTAIRQALTIASSEGRVKVIETFECKDGKTAKTVALLGKLEATGNVLLVVSQKDELVERATRNIPGIKAVSAAYLNVYDVVNADTIVIDQKSLPVISEWLGTKPAAKKDEAK